MPRDITGDRPCRCGSGLPHRDCCLRVDTPFSAVDRMAEFRTEVYREMEDKRPSSLEEAQAILGRVMERFNNTPREEFEGLSPEQMLSFLYHPFDSPELAEFASCLSAPPSAPIMTLFQLLVDGIGDKGIKPTATGKLPRKFVQEAALAYWGEEGYKEHYPFGDMRTELDFDDLHIARIAAEVAGLIRRYKGKFILGRECRAILKRHGMAGIYPRLLQAYAEEFNWDYRHLGPELDMIQETFLFSLYLISRYGRKWRANTFYENAFLRAFPRVLGQVGPVAYGEAEEEARRAYSRQCLEDFCRFFGLIEMNPEPILILRETFELRKTSLLDEVVQFRLPEAK
jgi:hypothetical protein